MPHVHFVPLSIAAFHRIQIEIGHELLDLAIFRLSFLARVLQPTIKPNFQVVVHRNDKDRGLGDCKGRYLFERKR